MKSIKPGRGPSAMSAWGSFAVALFGVFWTIGAASMGVPAMFVFFGVVFVITGIVMGLYHLRNATGENRYSAFDITEEGEETDPLEARFGAQREAKAQQSEAGFCPYCGEPAQAGYAFCRKCGRQLP